MKMQLLLCIALLISIVQPFPVLASPFDSPDLSGTIHGHRWGVWRIVDTTSHDQRVLANTHWILGGGPTEVHPTFRSYWVLGFGPFVALYVSQGTLLMAMALIIVLVVASAYLRRKRKQSTCP